MTPQAFKANPALWYHPSTNLDQMLSLLQHLANDGNVTVALLAADFAERTLPYAGSSKPHVTRCVTAVRTWAKGPTDANLQECKDAAVAHAAHAAATRQAEQNWQLAHVKTKHPLRVL